MMKIETMSCAARASVKLFAVLMISLWAPSAYSQSNQTPAAQPHEQFKTLIDPYIGPLLNGPKALSGLVVGVIHGDRKEVWGYGKVGPDGHTPDGETLFKIASVTKPLTALLLAQLTVEGKLAYNDTAFSFHGKPVTYRQLATHTSGLPLLPPNFNVESIEEFRRFLHDFTLEREPGSKFEYSTTGYSALGLRLAEKVGTSFEASLNGRLLIPLGMTSTVFVLPENRESRFAGATPPPPRKSGPNPFNPAGGLISSANDLLRLISAHLTPDKFPALAQAIRLTHEACPDVQPTFPGCSSSLGWFVVSFGPVAKFYFASGVTSGFRAFIAFDPAGNSGVVLLTNTDMQPEDARMEMAGFPLLAVLAQLPLDASSGANSDPHEGK